MKGFERILFLVTALEKMFDAGDWLHTPSGVAEREALASAKDTEAALDALWSTRVILGFDVAGRVLDGKSTPELERVNDLVREVRALTSMPTMTPYQFTLLAFVAGCDPPRYVARIRAVKSGTELGKAFSNLLFWPYRAMEILGTPSIPSKRKKSREQIGLFESVYGMAHQTGRWSEPDEDAQRAARARLNGCSSDAFLSLNDMEREAIAFLLLAHCGWTPLPLSPGP